MSGGPHFSPPYFYVGLFDEEQAAAFASPAQRLAFIPLGEVARAAEISRAQTGPSKRLWHQHPIIEGVIAGAMAMNAKPRF